MRRCGGKCQFKARYRRVRHNRRIRRLDCRRLRSFCANAGFTQCDLARGTQSLGAGIWGLVQDRVLSFGFILVVGFLLLISLILTAIIAFIGEWFGGFVPGVETLIQILNAILSLAVITLLFAMIFKFLPDVKIAWRDVWIGALITAALFTVGKEILGLYLGKSGVASSYGAAGSLIVLLLWVYYSAQIVFFGAEFTKAYANKFGSRVTPAENAIADVENPLDLSFQAGRMSLKMEPKATQTSCGFKSTAALLLPSM